MDVIDLTMIYMSSAIYLSLKTKKRNQIIKRNIFFNTYLSFTSQELEQYIFSFSSVSGDSFSFTFQLIYPYQIEEHQLSSPDMNKNLMYKRRVPYGKVISFTQNLMYVDENKGVSHLIGISGRPVIYGYTYDENTTVINSETLDDLTANDKITKIN